MPPSNEEIDSRNEIFVKAQTDPMFQDRKPLSNLQTTVTKHKHNMHNKINRGISPNQPPNSKPKIQQISNESENKTIGYHQSNIRKEKPKESSTDVRRSNSLKVKKENDKIPYSKSSRDSHRGGGSFVVPSSTTNKKSSSLTKSSKEANSAINLRSSYPKSNGNTIPTATTNNQNSNTNSSHYRLGSNYGMRNPGGSNFTANPRIRKTGTSNPSAHNTMASFRSGPVKIMNGESAQNQQPKQANNDAGLSSKARDASKRPSSASKANKKPTKMLAKTSNRPSTASTRTNSNRPPSPGSRSLKSDLLFSSYNRHK